MPDYKRLYYKLFAAMADATDALERQNYGTARDILIQAQQSGEEAHLADEEEAVKDEM